MTVEYESIVLQKGEGTNISTMGIDLSIKAGSDATGTGYSLMEYNAPPGWLGLPKHIHQGMEESFYVLEGELTIELGDERVKVGAGGFCQVPRGLAHTFLNSAAGLSTYLILLVPGGLEKYFEELSGLVAQYGYPPPPEIMADLASRYDMETVGPRPNP